ncbi:MULTISPECIES: MFS transporter [Streptomyces]|uniref:MFS transporter n=1 Tax=Streptomyces TaxID=1883 RepID=UPI00163C1D24|nr:MULTISPECIES: MFS transporter [Streptomyces]MBC2877003.1 MFS transporter [Streptomyces sp. TYQ1024]UBI36027.1 MFS transporter [Streptomyces mobaraensis]UKW28620.1 MFS transporter [Streptomyces sp. TYQ1024]
MPRGSSVEVGRDGSDPGAAERTDATVADVTVADVTVTDERLVRRAVKAAALGNAMEWFDFGVYSYLAVTIGDVFFPSGDGAVRLLSSLATFAVAFLVRPLGGLFFGPLGDRVGRKRVLALTMVLMAAGTFAIGLIPSYAAVGFWSPVLLIVFRMLQGFSTGGEYGGASTFIAEYAPDKRRGYYGSFLEFGTLAGYVGAAGLVTVMSTWLGGDGMREWGWRVPFLVAGPLGLVGLYLRLRLEDTPAFRKLAEEPTARTATREPAGLREIFATQGSRLVLCVVLAGAYGITDYMLLSYLPTYLTDRLGYDEAHGIVVLIVTMLLLMCLITFVGRLSDRAGRKPLLMAGMGGFVVLSVPAFLLIGQGGVAAVLGGTLLLGLSLVCLLGTMSAALPALFPTRVRYGSLSIGYNLSTSLFGGTTPLITTGLIHATGSDLAPAWYAMGAALVGVAAVACMKETAGRPLEGSPPSVSTEEEAAELTGSRGGGA